MPREFIKGERVVVEVTGKKPFHGTIIGKSRNGRWWNIRKDGTVSAVACAKDFCRPEVSPLNVGRRSLVEFSDVCDLLASIRLKTDGLVGAIWDGRQFKVTVAQPKTGKQVFAMSFDDERDFQRPSSELIDEFVKAAKTYFDGTSPNG